MYWVWNPDNTNVVRLQLSTEGLLLYYDVKVH